MICSKCGSECPENFNYCCVCGAKLYKPEKPIVIEDANTNDSVPTEKIDAIIKKYMIWSIFCTIFFCLPCGVIGIIYSHQARVYLDRLNTKKSYAKLKTALVWDIIGTIIGLIIIVSYIISTIISIFFV